MKVIYRDEAVRELDRIFDWIAAESPPRADKTIARIIDAIDGILCAYPQSGRMTASDLHVRRWLVKGLPYFVVYRHDAGSEIIEILSVDHTSRLARL